MRQYRPGELAKLLGVTSKTLSRWEADGKIESSRTDGGQRRYIYSEIDQKIIQKEGKKKVIYARVSSRKQQTDLERQVALLKHKYPTHEVITDIGSGINFKRRGLITLLDRVIAGDISQVVVAHKDRLTRFGFDLFEHIFNRFGVRMEVVSDNDVKEPTEAFVDDVLSIITVFTAKYYGSRKYNLYKKNKDLSKQRAEDPIQKVSRGFKVRIQQNHSQSKIKRVIKRSVKT